MADRSNTFYAVSDSAMHGYGAQLMVGDGGGSETFQAIAAIRVITPGDMSTADFLTTHLRSPDGHHEHKAGMRDSGPIDFEGTWLPTDESQSNAGGGSGSFTSGGLIALWRGRQNHNFKIVLPDQEGSPSLEWPFRGYVSRFQPGSITVDDQPITFSSAIQPTEAYDADLP